MADDILKLIGAGAWASRELQRRPYPGGNPSREGSGGRERLVTVRCTSATPDANGNYPGIVTVEDSQAATWTDFGVVVLHDINGEALEADTVYGCQLGGTDPDGVPNFQVVGGGAGGAAGSIPDAALNVSGQISHTTDQFLGFADRGVSRLVVAQAGGTAGSGTEPDMYVDRDDPPYNSYQFLAQKAVLGSLAFWSPLVGTYDNIIRWLIPITAAGPADYYGLVYCERLTPGSDAYGRFHVTTAGLVSASPVQGDLYFDHTGLKIGAGAYQVGSAVGKDSDVGGDVVLTGGIVTTYAMAVGDLLYCGGAADRIKRRAIGTAGQVLTVSGGVPVWASPGAGAWGTITGTLSGQADLQAALDLKADAADLAGLPTLGTLAGQDGTFSGTHSGDSSGTNTGDQLVFKTISVAGQSDVVADSATDTLTLAAGSGITITTNAGADTVTIAASGGTLDITGLTAADPALDDEVPVYDLSATANRKVTAAEVLGLARQSPGGRLSFVTGDPTGTVSTATTLYYTFRYHDCIWLYDGTRWVLVHFAETSLALGTVVSGTGYDVFGYLSAGALALEKLAWSGANTRATAVSYQDGRLCKSGDKTRLLLGSFRAVSTTQGADASNARLLSNVYNPWPRALVALEAADSWTYSTNSWRQANNSTANKVEVFCSTADNWVALQALALTTNSSNSAPGVGIGVDATGTNWASLYGAGGSSSALQVNGAHLKAMLTAGYHALNWLEIGAAVGTTTWYGDAGTTYLQSGLLGEVWN